MKLLSYARTLKKNLTVNQAQSTSRRSVSLGPAGKKGHKLPSNQASPSLVHSAAFSRCDPADRATGGSCWSPDSNPDRVLVLCIPRPLLPRLKAFLSVRRLVDTEDRRMGRGRAGEWVCSPPVPEIFEIFWGKSTRRKHSKRQ